MSLFVADFSIDDDTDDDDDNDDDDNDEGVEDDNNDAGEKGSRKRFIIMGPGSSRDAPEL
jgi:hypothetical protein